MEELIIRLGDWYQKEGLTQDIALLDDAQQLSLTLLFTTWFQEKLCCNGNNAQSIKQEYRKLALLFHPDKMHGLDNAVLMANNLLANDSQTPLFACLLYTKELLLQNIESKAAQPEGENTTHDFFQNMLSQLEKRAEKTRFEGKRQILRQVIDMLHAYKNKTEEKRYKEAAISLISKGFPFAITAFCVMSYMPQCLALLAVTKLAQTGGDYIHNMGGSRAQYIGDTLKRSGEALQKAGLGIFSAVIAGYLQGMHLTGSAIKQVLLIEPARAEEEKPFFKNQDIEKIVRPLTVYLDEVRAQWALPLRKGAGKERLVLGVFEKIKMIDDANPSDWSQQLKEILENLASSRQKGMLAVRIGETLTRFDYYAPETKEQTALVLR